MQTLQELKQDKEIIDSNVGLTVKYNNHLDYMDAYERTDYLENQYNRPYQ